MLQYLICVRGQQVRGKDGNTKIPVRKLVEETSRGNTQLGKSSIGGHWLIHPSIHPFILLIHQNHRELEPIPADSG